jgi:hypothetical protein
MTTAKNRAIDQARRARKFEASKGELVQAESVMPDVDDEIGDDLLRLMLIACHPILPTEARTALTLRLLGGLTVPEIARAFLVPEPTIQQRIVRAKAKIREARIPYQVQGRGELAARYTRALAEVPEVETPVVRPEVTSNWHLYVVRLHLDRLSIDRDTFITELKKRGVGTSVHYFPVHYHPYYRENYGFRAEDYPVVGTEFERLISLPLFPLMQDADVDRVVEATEAIVAEYRR